MFAGYGFNFGMPMPGVTGSLRTFAPPMPQKPRDMFGGRQITPAFQQQIQEAQQRAKQMAQSRANQLVQKTRPMSQPAPQPAPQPTRITSNRFRNGKRNRMGQLSQKQMDQLNRAKLQQRQQEQLKRLDIFSSRRPFRGVGNYRSFGRPNYRGGGFLRGFSF